MIQRPLRRLAAFVTVGVLAGSLGGCFSLLPQNKPSALYSFSLAETAEAPMNPRARGVTLEPVDFPREAMGDGILTVEGPQTSYLAGARWAAPATVMFRQALERAFDSAAPGAHLLNRGEAGPSAGLLAIDVTRFEADYTDPKAPPTVRVTLRVRLAGVDGSAIDATTYDVRKPAAENRVEAIVAAYDAATVEALTALARWVDEKAPAADPAHLAPRSTSRSSSIKSTETTTSNTTTRQP